MRDQLQKMLDKFYSGELEVCGTTCRLLLDVIWEHLNTGHWKDVDITWRFAYSYVSLYKAACEIASMNRGALHYEEAIKTCDMGLLMGAPVWGNILNTLVTELQRLQCSNKESRGVPHPPTNPSTCTKSRSNSQYTSRTRGASNFMSIPRTVQETTHGYPNTSDCDRFY